MNDSISRQAALDAVFYNAEHPAKAYKEIRLLPSAQPEQRWIPCSERLPEELVESLITSEGGYVDISRIVHGEWEYDGNVIAWMPLPEPYKEEKKK